MPQAKTQVRLTFERIGHFAYFQIWELLYRMEIHIVPLQGILVFFLQLIIGNEK